MEAYTYFLNGYDPATNALVSQAFDDVQASGLSIKTLEKAGVRISSGDGDELKKKLGFSSIDGNAILKM